MTGGPGTRIFAAEAAGTFGLLVAAAGSMTYDGLAGFSLGPAFVSMMHFAGLSVLIFVFGRYSMAHFNPAVTLGFAISGHARPGQIPVYLAAQAVGAMAGIVFVRYAVGDYANLGLNAPSYEYAPSAVFAVETAAAVFLMGGILLITGVKRANAAVVGMVVGAIVALDVFFLGPVSGASMNPMRSLAPALATGMTHDLWLYWTAPFLGAAIPAIICRRKSAVRRPPQ